MLARHALGGKSRISFSESSSRDENLRSTLRSLNIALNVISADCFKKINPDRFSNPLTGSLKCYVSLDDIKITRQNVQTFSLT